MISDFLANETVHTYGEDLEVTQGRGRVSVARHDASFVVLEVGECADPSSFNSSVVFAVAIGGLPKR